MIRINAPVIEEIDGRKVLKAYVENDNENFSDWLWYASDIENGKFFCEEVADAFVLPMILRAIKTHQDIEVNAPMSEKLYYNLNEAVFYSIAKCVEQDNKKELGFDTSTFFCPSIKSKKLVNMDFHPFAVGTGCSLGVDSFAVLKHNLFNESCPPSYRITHITLFNAGAFGYKADERMQQSFNKEVEKTKLFAKEVGLPFVWVDSNVRSFYPELSFDWSHTYLNMGIVLAMQKLWKLYLYASGYPIYYFKFDINDSAKSEPFIIPLLSTENTELISANMNMSRSDKVEYIAKDEIVRNHLYVCLKEQQANGPLHRKNVNGFLNCGYCEKCRRTLLQLDILGQLDGYDKIFDLSDWKKIRNKYIARVLVKRKNNYMYRDLYSSMLKHNFNIPLQSRILSIIYSKYSPIHLFKKI